MRILDDSSTHASPTFWALRTAHILGTTETVSMKTRGSPPRTKGLAYEWMPGIVNGDGAPKLRSM
jgi:hypothetical protein